MEKILNGWKQRNLTLLGKSMLIDSLSTSLFTYNCQIDSPPADFLNIVEKLHKSFLWQGVSKIAHRTIIAPYKQGGIRYRDLKTYLPALNLKFIQNLFNKDMATHLILPNHWIKKLFGLPTSTDEHNHFYTYFQSKFDILICFFKLPRMNKYRGHPFYYGILKSYENLAGCYDVSLETIVSTPIWFNKYLKTQFDVEISKAGFNYIKNILPDNNCWKILGVSAIEKFRN